MCILCNNSNSPDAAPNSEAPWVLSFWHIEKNTQLSDTAASIKICTNGPHRHPSYESAYVSEVFNDLKDAIEASGRTLLVDALGSAVGHHIVAYLTLTSSSEFRDQADADKSHLFIIHRDDTDPEDIMHQHSEIARMELMLSGHKLD